MLFGDDEPAPNPAVDDGELVSLIAGLGIGGLALAMAAKDTVSNIFGGFTIFSDRPFKLNDRVKVSGYDGTITDIGVANPRAQGQAINSTAAPACTP